MKSTAKKKKKDYFYFEKKKINSTNKSCKIAAIKACGIILFL